jgi:hypothetical protein
MVSDLFFYALLLLGLLWMCVMLSYAGPSDRSAGDQRTSKPIPPPHKRSSDPQPFPGLTRKPHCATCEQAAQGPAALPPAAPPPITSRRGRPRQVDASRHFCPNPICAYRGWVGWGNLRANGLPTICQPPFVNFLPHLHDWLTTNSACIIAGAMTQHGHKNTQQSVANIA